MAKSAQHAPVCVCIDFLFLLESADGKIAGCWPINRFDNEDRFWQNHETDS